MRVHTVPFVTAFLAASLDLVCSFSTNAIPALQGFAPGQNLMLRPQGLAQPGMLVSGLRPSLRSSHITMMAKGKGKKGKKGKGQTKTKARAKPAAETAPAAAAEPAKAAPAPVAHKEETAHAPKAEAAPAPIPKAALVDDDGVEDAALMAKANEALNAAKATLGDGVGIGGGELVTFTGPDDKEERTMPKDHFYGINGDATVVKATSKTLTVRLSGKFWANRQWAMDAVTDFFKTSMPGMKVVVEDPAQLMDLYINDVWYDEEAWQKRYEGPQYINERGVQVAQPFNADGSIKQADFNEDALKLGIEEMMVDALQQSQGTFLDSAGYEDINRQLAMSQTAYLEESQDAAELGKDDDNILSVSKVNIPDEAPEPFDIVDDKVGKALKGNPMFEKMADALEQEPGAIEDMMKLLDASNGNLFAVMSNPKFQSLAQKMMANPELMQMMQDPDMLKQAMSSAQDIGLTDALGVKPNLDPSTAAKGFADQATEAIKSGLGVGGGGSPAKEVETPDWMKAKEAEVRERASKMQDMKSLTQQDAEPEVDLDDEIRRAREKVPPAPEKSSDFNDGDTFSFEDLLEESRSDVQTVGSGSAGLSDSAKENLLYAAGFVFGVGGIVFFFATQLGVIDIPFMKDLGSVSTPATRRMAGPPGTASQSPAKVVDTQDDTPF